MLTLSVLGQVFGPALGSSLSPSTLAFIRGLGDVRSGVAMGREPERWSSHVFWKAAGRRLRHDGFCVFLPELSGAPVTSFVCSTTHDVDVLVYIGAPLASCVYCRHMMCAFQTCIWCLVSLSEQQNVESLLSDSCSNADPMAYVMFGVVCCVEVGGCLCQTCCGLLVLLTQVLKPKSGAS